jgi:DNA replication initiation complex subunit (GINS family)
VLYLLSFFIFRLSKNLHEKLKLARRKIKEHGTEQRYRKMRKISEAASMARSILHKKVRQLRAHATQTFQPTADQKQLLTSDSRFTAEAKNGRPTESMSTSVVEINKQPSGIFRMKVQVSIETCLEDSFFMQKLLLVGASLFLLGLC